MADRLRRALTSPRFVFPALALVVLLTVLLTPRDRERAGDPRLTTHSAAPQGARALHETLHRLGWRVDRRATPIDAELEATATYAVLDPPIDLGGRETRRLLDAVRQGAGLIFVAKRGTALSDSLALRASVDGGVLRSEPTVPCPAGGAGSERGAINWVDGRVHSYWLTPPEGLPAGAITFATVTLPDVTPDRDVTSDSGALASTRRLTAPAAVGFPFGRGRVVAVADPDLLRNDVLRVCRWDAGATAVRMFAWLAEAEGATRSGARHVVFDEYHQGFGAHADPLGAVRRALTDTPPGRVLLQGIAATLILLLALGGRPLPPRPRARVERRSPLEHVGALAQAYQRVGATRLATRRLVHGLKRRHAGAAARADDEELLRQIAARHPELAPDVARLLDGTRRPLTATDFVHVGTAIDHIERTLRQ
jgi:hypothetical protein